VAKKGKKTTFSKVRSFVTKNFNRRQVRKLVKSVVKDVFGESEAEQFKRVRSVVRNANPGPARVFLGNQTQRSWSPLTKSLGAKILRMGPNVPADLRAAAEDAVNGVGDYKNEKELQDIMRRGMGIEKSGASWLNRKVAALRRGIQGAAQAGVMFDQAQMGGFTGGAARGALTDMALGKAGDLLKGKMAEKIAINLANAMGANPAKFTAALLQISRGLRMGGAIGAIVQTGAAVADEYFQQRKRSASAQIATFNSARAASVSAKLAKDIRQGVGVVKETGVMGAIKGALGFHAEADEERARRTGEVYRLTAESRAVAGRMGVDVAAVLDSLAKSKGVAVEDLSAQEVNNALDPLALKAARGTISSEAIKAKLITDKVVAGNTLDKVGQVTTDATGAGALSLLTGPAAPVVAPLLFDFMRGARKEAEEAAAKAAETDLANRRVADLKNQPGRVEDANRRRQSDVPPKFIQSSHQGQGGEVFMIPNPEYDRYVAERRKTTEQVRTYGMEQRSYSRRKQTVWAD